MPGDPVYHFRSLHRGYIPMVLGMGDQFTSPWLYADALRKDVSRRFGLSLSDEDIEGPWWPDTLYPHELPRFGSPTEFMPVIGHHGQIAGYLFRRV